MNLRQRLIRFYMQTCNFLFGIDNDSVVFKSFDNQFSCNPRAICEKLYELNPNLKFYWIFSDPDSVSDKVPKYIIKIKEGTFSKLRILATSKIWVDNCIKVPSTWKSDKQFYIQTWHGDKAFKKIGYDAGKLSSDFEKYGPKFDLAISGSEYGRKKYINAYHYNGEILNVGTPRNDILVNIDENKIKKIKESLNIDSKKKILLYAPTFRDNKIENKQKFNGLNLKEILNKLKEKDNNEWVCLLRTHHLVKSGFDSDEISNNIIDVSDYDDMADLLLISDMMITDYSSCAGDYALTGRMLVLYQSDYEDYIKNSRTFYFDIEKSPYFIAKNQEELLNIIKNITPNEARKNCDEILEFYGSNETGNSSQIIAERILKEMKK